MIRGVYNSTSGMNYLKYKMDVTANNIANSNTVGFKRDRVFLRTLNSIRHIYQMNTTEQRNLDEVHENFIDRTMGSLNVTGNPLDFALEGPGFFTVQTQNGARYTRNGNFTINADGLLTTKNGYPLMGEMGQISIQGNEVIVDGEGNIYVDDNIIDRFAIVEFEEPRKITKIGEGLFNGDEAIPIPGAPNTRVLSGTLEDSNVNAIEEMVSLLTTSQFFESGQKSIIMQDETIDRAVNDVGRVTR